MNTTSQQNQPQTHPVSSISRAMPYSDFGKIFVGGKWREGTSSRENKDVNPYNGETLIQFHGASIQDVDDAYKAAALVQREWADAPPQYRRNILLRVADILVQRKEEIIDWLIRETGSTRPKATVEWSLVHEGTLEASTYPFRMDGKILPCSIPGKESRVYRAPVGVVGVISPWDFSLQLTNRSVAPALACGNTVVLKPASVTPITGGFLWAKVYEEAGLPPGVLSVVAGQASEIGDAFVSHPIPRLITFTGSTAAGRRIGELCGRNIKRSALELGGNAPFVVLDDADLEVAVNAGVFGKFLNSGQICMAINRFVVDESVYDEFVSRFVQRVRQLKAGDPRLEDVDIGPMIDQEQFDRTKKLLDDTLKAGAQMILGGDPEGLVMKPTVLVGVTNDMPAAQNEIFGPIAIIIRVKGEEEAVRVANATRAGLSSTVCSSDLNRGVRVAKQIKAGMTHVNDIPINDEANSPFGGEKESGYGRFGGIWALNEFTTEHWITVQEKPRPYLF